MAGVIQRLVFWAGRYLVDRKPENLVTENVHRARKGGVRLHSTTLGGTGPTNPCWVVSGRGE